jgi:single-strand DNA-binding protein
MNKVFLIGNVGSDPEFKQTQNSSLASFSIAVNEKRKVNDNYETKTTWFKVVHFGKGAEFTKKFIKKGMKIHVEGKLEISTFASNDGTQKQSISVIAENINIFEKIEKQIEHENTFFN